jgi:hypothetical protein
VTLSEAEPRAVTAAQGPHMVEQILSYYRGQLAAQQLFVRS